MRVMMMHHPNQDVGSDSSCCSKLLFPLRESLGMTRALEEPLPPPPPLLPPSPADPDPPPQPESSVICIHDHHTCDGRLRKGERDAGDQSQE